MYISSHLFTYNNADPYGKSYVLLSRHRMSHYMLSIFLGHMRSPLLSASFPTRGKIFFNSSIAHDLSSETAGFVRAFFVFKTHKNSLSGLQDLG